MMMRAREESGVCQTSFGLTKTLLCVSEFERSFCTFVFFFFRLLNLLTDPTSQLFVFVRFHESSGMTERKEGKKSSRSALSIPRRDLTLTVDEAVEAAEEPAKGSSNASFGTVGPRLSLG
jgi:hypothetical protein